MYEVPSATPLIPAINFWPLLFDLILSFVLPVPNFQLQIVQHVTTDKLLLFQSNYRPEAQSLALRLSPSLSRI